MTTTQATTSKGIAKLFGALALASGASAALPSCATDPPSPETGTIGTSEQGLVCGKVTTCPDDSGTCGTWTCTSLGACSFKAARSAGDACVLPDNSRGACIEVGDGRLRPQYLECCTGCFTGKVGLGMNCHPGNAVGYCGAGGERCDVCNDCETCTNNSCAPTTGNACGTCQVCNAGSCDSRAVGASCSGGHCAAGNTCCTGNACIKDGSCVAAADANCGSDGNACTDCGQCGTCSGGACQDRTGACDDGNPCTENDTCADGTCAGTAINVDDGNPCTKDECSTSSGVTHTSFEEGATGCSDGNDCSTGDRCTDHDNDSATPRICQATGGVICENENPCKSLQCVNNACPFPDMPNDTPCAVNRCVLEATCQSGTCTGEMRNCNDDNPCTTDTCEPDVDDPDADPATGCKHVPRTASCDDGNPCTDDDACDAGTCAGTPITCAALDECHGIGTCDPGVGECTDPRLQDGTGCENTGTCETGKCVGGTPTGTGGAGGSAGSGSGGTGTGGTGQSGEAGEGSGAASGEGGGSTGGSGGNTGGSGNTGGRNASGGTGASSGDGGKFSGPTFVRDPGGCSCEMPGATSRPGNALGVILAGAFAYFTRRRRRAA